MRATVFAVLLGLTTALAATSAEACSRSVSAKAAKTVVPASRIDQGLLDAAVRAEVNFHRCRAGLSRLGNAGARLNKQSRNHSAWMASTQNLKHRGQTTLQQRVRAAGIKAKAGAENIGMVHRYRIDNQHFRIIDRSSCQFANQKGQALPPHTYASLARHIVDLWMGSPGHRKNILNRKVSKVTTSVAFDPKTPYCGKYWLTQAFVG